jgi:hypothetical protein
MKIYAAAIMLAGFCLAQDDTPTSAPTPISTPIVDKGDQDVYDTRKITSPGTTVICETTAYVYGINVAVNSIGTGGRIIIRDRTGFSLFNAELSNANTFRTWGDGIPMNDGIEIASEAEGCDVDVKLDYRR